MEGAREKQQLLKREERKEREWLFMDDFWFKVTFILRTSSSSGAEEPLMQPDSKVYLAGDFNQWRAKDDSYEMKPCSEGFSVTKLLSEGFYHYKFLLVDHRNKENQTAPEGVEKWLRDFDNPHIGGEHQNSVMFVHMDPNVYGLHSQHPPHRDYHRQGSNGSEFQVLCPAVPPDIAAMGVLRRLIFVYLPPSYNAEERRRYPVIYTNDGQNIFSTPGHCGGPCKGGLYLDEKLDQFWNQNLIPEFILVGVPNSDFVCIGNRTREYCTSQFQDTSEDPYKRYLVEVVKKEIDGTFRTDASPRGTGILGSSMGGLCAFAISLNHPDTFSFSACISPSFWYLDRDNVSAYDLVRFRAKSTSPRIYLDSGDGPGDNFYETKEMREVMIESGWTEGERFAYILDECADRVEFGATHLECVWKERILKALQFGLLQTLE